MLQAVCVTVAVLKAPLTLTLALFFALKTVSPCAYAAGVARVPPIKAATAKTANTANIVVLFICNRSSILLVYYFYGKKS